MKIGHSVHAVLDPNQGAVDGLNKELPSLFLGACKDVTPPPGSSQAQRYRYEYLHVKPVPGVCTLRENFPRFSLRSCRGRVEHSNDTTYDTL